MADPLEFGPDERGAGGSVDRNPSDSQLAGPEDAVNVLLISMYELGRQPFGVASPAAWLRRLGVKVRCLDLAVEKLDSVAITEADFIAFYIPMHTATRIAVSVLPRVQRLNPTARICFYGLYAPVNESYLRSIGGDAVLGGEFEAGLVELVEGLRAERRGESPWAPPQKVSLERLRFIVPDRTGLPDLDRYAKVQTADGLKTVGYTEASRGCRHRCRHCPIVPVYDGRFRIVQRDIVLADIRQQVEAGAVHITFGDPDFFNGPAHAISIVKALHEEYPSVTYDVTIKIQHLRDNEHLIPVLKASGCLFVTSAVEAIDEPTLLALDKHHTMSDLEAVVRTFRAADLNINPTFVTFTPWTSLRSYLLLLETMYDLGLVDSVSPIQYAIRLLIPYGSRLLELPLIAELVEPFDANSLTYPWKHPDPAVDELHTDVLEMVQQATRNATPRTEVFNSVLEFSHQAVARSMMAHAGGNGMPRAPVPYLTEPWYC